MMGEKTAALLQWMMQKKENNKEFWDELGDWCDKNGLARQFYCPYVPLQKCKAIYPGVNSAPIAFKTRYGVIKVKNDED